MSAIIGFKKDDQYIIWHENSIFNNNGYKPSAIETEIFSKKFQISSNVYNYDIFMTGNYEHRMHILNSIKRALFNNNSQIDAVLDEVSGDDLSGVDVLIIQHVDKCFLKSMTYISGLVGKTWLHSYPDNIELGIASFPADFMRYINQGKLLSEDDYKKIFEFLSGRTFGLCYTPIESKYKLTNQNFIRK